MSRKVMIIGIDGGTWRVLRPAMEAGAMPQLKQLVERGSWGELESTIPAKTPAAWGSFQTGVNPGGNGVYDFFTWDKQRKSRQYVSSQSLRPTVWELASAAGKRVGVLNVPMTYPPKAVNGCVVSGLLTPSLESEFTYPAGLKGELLKAVPGYHIFNLGNITKGSQHREFEGFVGQMAAVVENRAKAGAFLIGRDDFDVCMVHFQASDVIQHGYWGYLDATGELYDAERCRYLYERFYRVLDEKIGELWGQFQRRSEGEKMLYVVSDHGFQRHYKRFRLGNWLVEQGYLRVRKKGGGISWKERIRKVDVLGLRRLAAGTELGQRMEARLGKTEEPYEWAGSRVFSVSRGSDGLVFLLEEAQEDRRRTERELREKLGAVADPERGEKIVERIYTKEELYQGGQMAIMPDLIVQLKGGYSCTGDYAGGAEGWFHEVRAESDFHMGMHERAGILVAAGQGIREGQEVEGASLLDVAPTILGYLGIAIPEEMDGRVLEELFVEGMGVRYAEGAEGQEQTGGVMEYSEAEQRQIEERLRGLGYME